MSGPKLQPYQSEATPTAEQRAWLARELADGRHVPTRTCLGCGHSGPDRWYVMCHGWGVAAWRSTSAPDEEFHTEEFRLSWAEVARLAAAEGVQAAIVAEVAL